MKGHQTILWPHCLLLCDSFPGITRGHQHQKRELCLNKLVTWRDLHNCYIWRNFEYAVLPGMLQLAGRFQPWCSWSFLILTFYPRLTWWWLSPQVRYVKWNGYETIETSLLFGFVDMPSSTNLLGDLNLESKLSPVSLRITLMTWNLALIIMQASCRAGLLEFWEEPKVRVWLKNRSVKFPLVSFIDMNLQFL